MQRFNADQNGLTENNDLYRSMIENSRDGIIIAQFGKFKFVNLAFCNMVEYSAEELIESDFLTVVADEEKERLLEFHRMRMSGETHQMIYEARGISKSGRSIYFEINTSYIDYNGQPATFIILRDHTAQKAMQEALEKSERKFRELADLLPQTVYELDSKGNGTYLNKAGQIAMGFIGKEVRFHALDGVIPEDRNRMIENMKKTFQEKRLSFSSEYTALRKDGSTFPAIFYSAAMFENGEFMGTRGLIIDISERIKAEKEIKAAQKKLEQINMDLELTIRERTEELTKANTQLLILQKENLQSQFDVLKQQVNPHFLFNSLNVLTSLIRLEPELAEKFTEHLAKVYRYVLENKDNELVSLSTEISFLNAYIFLINIRFMDKIMVNIRIPDDKMNLQIIPLAMQLLIENAIKHNAMSKKSPLVIDISIDHANHLKVVNNLQVREAHMTSTGVGLKNIQNRYRLLNNSIPVFEKTDTHFIATIPLIAE